MDLQEFVALGQQWLPALSGRFAEPDNNELTPESWDANLSNKLIDSLKTAHPEAGRHYWSARSWTLLTWQPVCLTLGAAMVAGQRFPIQQLCQRTTACMVAGYSLQAEQFESVQPAGLIESAASALRQYTNGIYTQLSSQTPLSETLALRLLADRVLSVLLLMRKLLELESSQIERLGQHWLKAMDLEGYSALMTITMTDGSERLALNRKGCCQDYRRSDGQLCNTCPRQKIQLRMQRLQSEAETDV